MIMLGLFRRAAGQGALDTAGLGASVIALPMPAGCTIPPACSGIIFNSAGSMRRAMHGERLALTERETAYCFHPGPYEADIVPFAAAPEIGLRVSFAIDSPDPRSAQQRFDLFLASEARGPVELAAFAQAIEAALQCELAQGNLDLPPCTTLDEWNAFRAGFNQLMYTRFGVIVDECMPVDLGDHRDFAAMLQARAAGAAPESVLVTAPAALAGDFDPADVDAKALRRLFLELPCVMCRLRLAVLPPGQALFRLHQELLRRLDLVSLSVGTMPALGLAAPSQPLAAGEQRRRARDSHHATVALNEAWALLARLGRAGDGQLPALFDEADRVVANLEHATAARRALAGPDAEEDA
jgi:hypothetical protein